MRFKLKILFFRETELKDLNPSVMRSHGLAGTENSIICLAHELSKRHTVKVIAPQLKQQFFDKVEYIPFQSYAEALVQALIFSPDIFIVCGNPQILFEQEFRKTIFWQQNHPLELIDRFNIPALISQKIKIVAPSPEAAKYYNTYYKTDKIIGIYNGVRDEFFKQQRKPITDKITYCGSFTRAKGLNQVLKTAQKLPEYQFYLCGSFDLYGFVDQSYKDYCLKITSNNTHYLGSLPADKLAQEMASSSLCIANPLVDNHETCCVSALEAMVVGTPVVTGSSEILQPIIDHGGVTTRDLTAVIKELMSLQPVYNQMRPIYANEEFVKSLSWDSISRQWEEFLMKGSS